MQLGEKGTVEEKGSEGRGGGGPARPRPRLASVVRSRRQCADEATGSPKGVGLGRPRDTTPLLSSFSDVFSLSVLVVETHVVKK